MDAAAHQLLPFAQKMEPPPPPRRTGPARNHPLHPVLLRLRPHLAKLQVGLLLLFLLLVLLPLGLDEPAEQERVTSHFTLLANYLIWGLWFPLLLVSVIATGRSWCGLFCPMGSASEWVNRLGLRRPVPPWLRWSSLPLLSFTLVTLLGQTLGVRDHPEAIAGVFGGTLLCALGIGFVYGRRQRVWCRHLCPVGPLLGVLSRLGAVVFQPTLPLPGADRIREGSLCPTGIDLRRKRSSRHCIECLRCLHDDPRRGLIRVELRPPGREVASIQRHSPDAAEVGFLFLGTGLALGGFLWLSSPLFVALRQTLGDWVIDRGWYGLAAPGPAWLMSVHPGRREVFSWIDFLAINGFMLGCAVVLGLVLWGCARGSAALALRGGVERKAGELAVCLGYQYAPVALVSLVVGLGAELFSPLALIGLSASAIATLKFSCYLAGAVWSIHLGRQILRETGIRGRPLWLAQVPGALGVLLVGAGWYPALFG